MTVSRALDYLDIWLILDSFRAQDEERRRGELKSNKWERGYVVCQSTKLAWQVGSAGAELELNSTMEAASHSLAD